MVENPLQSHPWSTSVAHISCFMALECSLEHVQISCDVIASDLLWITTVLIRHHVSYVVITWCHVVITDVSCHDHVMSCDLFSHRDAKELVTTKQSKWKQQWQRLRENNPISNGQSPGLPSQVLAINTCTRWCWLKADTLGNHDP